MDEMIYNGQRLKIQLNSRDESNNNTGIDLSTAQLIKIKIKANGITTAYDASLVVGDNYSCYINYTVAFTGRHTAWIYAEISGTEKYYSTPYEFDTNNEGEL